MHRSGTSATTRLLSLLGSALPRHLMPPAPNDNARGFWESPRVAELHDEMLAEAGSSWDDFLPMSPGWQESSLAQRTMDKILECLREEFGDARFFVLKDPRICRLVPMWLEILRRFEAIPQFVLTLRNPLEVARSLQARDGFPLSKSLMLWIRHVLDGELHTRGQARHVRRL